MDAANINSIAADFLETMFDSELPVYICSLPNERNDETEPGERTVATRVPSHIAGFVAKWDRPKRGLFFCTGIVKQGARRAKENIVQTACLHTDIDFSNLDGDPDRAEVLRQLARLRYPPSIIVFSGHGLHCYWLFKEAVDTQENIERIETALRQLADLVGGDLQCCEVARLMRLPGTHNTKDGEWTEVEIVEQNGRRYELDDLEEWLSEASPVILRKVKVREHAKSVGEIEPAFYERYAEKYGFRRHVDVEDLLRGMIYMRGDKYGVHPVQIKVTSSLLSRGYPLDEVVDLVMEATRIAAGEYSERWNWVREERAIRRDGTKWIAEHREAIEEKQRERDEEMTNADPRSTVPKSSQAMPDAEPKTLADVHEVFRRWLGKDYDIDALNAVLSVAACERLPGDPPWLLVISGSGNAKTETVQSVTGLGALVVSTIASDGALLSASSRKQKSKTATGGLLRVIGERGILVIKDFTSIISAAREVRGSILAALREIYDGRWVRNVGTDGGQTLSWEGRLVVIGACTTAWDTAHSVIATMGDRFVTIRPDSSKGREDHGRRAIRNTGSEITMRQEMADAVAGLVSHIDVNAPPYELTDDDEDKIVKAADIVTLARTGVETDYRGDVIDAHDPEAPTRLAKQLTQVLRGAMAIGMDHDAALNLTMRCARDSMPPLRLAVLKDVANHPGYDGLGSPVMDIRRRLQKPRTTTDRTLQALHILGLLICHEEEREKGDQVVQHRRYRLADEVNIAPLYGDGQPPPEPEPPPF
ncbi:MULTISPECIES: DNA-primase RepB domain-containing protein [Bradyrhizobium]|uniref:DNA-primase RepB domain-containing protein n=1 Tax=Bradyrhizobium elkanii TaxID=29448 RepID=UPI0004157EE1|nr:DNA-primase RepB domain-containing protein [Bradyrhizobium elkanii]